MNIETKFNPKDVIFKLVLEHEHKKQMCNICNGNGRLFSKDGKNSIPCQYCGGSGETLINLPSKWVVKTFGRVSKVVCNIYDEKDIHIKYQIKTTYGLTCIAGGDEYFNNEAVAQIECNIRNRKRKK